MIPAHSLVGERADRWMLVLHGIYGSGANWRTFARRLTEKGRGWGAVLVDLRMHGESQDAQPPHTVAAAAGDLNELAGVLSADGRPVRAVCGHSFGGKVALAYVADHGADLDAAWILDSSPSARPGALGDPKSTVAAVLRMLEGLPDRFDDRDAFVDYVQKQGYPKMVGQWLAMNLVPAGDAHRFGLDPKALRSLLADYFERDLWRTVESPPCPLHVIAAGCESALSDDDRDRLRALADEPGSRLTFDTLEDASHWLHVDALDALLDLVSGQLASS